MSRTYDKKLLKRLSGVLNKSEKYTREQISKRAGSLGVLPESYFVLSLIENKIPASKYIKTLDLETRHEIQQNLSLSKRVIKRSKIPKSISTKKSKGKDTTTYRVIPQLLLEQDISNSEKNLEYYRYIYLIENSTRNFIMYFLEKDYGKNWWNHSSGQKAVVIRDIRNKVKFRQNEEMEDPIHEIRGSHELAYTDFKQLALIIEHNNNTFDPNCRMLSGKSTFISQMLRTLAPTRNVVAHMGVISKKDSDRLKVDWKDLYSAYERISKVIINKST